MAAVVASKPLLPPKAKRPPAPYIQTSINGTKPSPVPASPSSATKRLPGQKHPPPTPSSTISATNGIARPKRKESQRPGDPYGRPPRLQTRNNIAEGGSFDRRTTRVFPAPYGVCNKLSSNTLAEADLLPTVPSDAHILKKFKGQPPSLIVHLHPTHFRFDQQDGSFSYHSEMRLFIEHLQKKTIPHDMLEEFKNANVQFYDGWLIVRVVDHKSVSASAGPSSNTDPDDQIPFSIHNYNPYITPSPWVPYPAQTLPKPPSRGRSSPVPKQEPGEASTSQMNGDYSTLNGESASKAKKPQPKIFHVALRPTNLSKHMDLVIDSMTPDSRTLNRRQSQAFPARTPGASSMPAPGTPLSAIPPTPSLEKGPPLKRQKMKVDPKDLLDYEAGVVRATAPPVFLDPVKTFEEAQALQHFLRDPLYEDEPPSPKGRKRTVAELAADDALAKEQERFMLIMDERNSGGSAAVNANAADGQAAAGLFQPRFERFNALDNIKAQAAEKKREEARTRFHQHEAQQLQKAQQEEEKQRMEMARAQQRDELRRRQMLQERQQQQQAALAAQQQHAMPQLNGVPPNMQRQMMQASQAQGASPIVRTSTPHVSSSPIVGQTRPGHSVPMTVTSSNQGGAGSPPRPGSALQHGHPGIAMARSQSNQGPSRNGTPQVSHSTPGMPHATPVMRHGTPAQQMSQASPHGSMMAHTPQMGHAMMGSGQMPAGMAQNPQTVQQMQAAQQQQQLIMQRQQQNLARQGMPPNMPNGGQQYSPEQFAHIQAQQHARQQAALHHQQQQQQQHLQAQQGGNQIHSGVQTPAQNQAAYQAALMQSQKTQMAQAQMNQQGMQQGSPPQPHSTPQQHAAQMQHQASLQQQQLAQNQGQNLQLPNGMTQQQQQHLQHQQLQRAQQMHTQLMSTNQAYNQQYQARSQTLFKQHMTQLMQQANGDHSRIPQQQIDSLKMQVSNRAMREIQDLMKRQQQQRAHQQQQQMGAGGPVGGGQNPAMMQQMQAQQQAHLQAQHQQQQQQQQQTQNMLQYQQQLQQMQQQGHQGAMMNGLPGAGVLPK
jgi:transcription factor SPT20